MRGVGKFLRCSKTKTYLVTSNAVDYWYIIQQKGQRLWEAMVFSHCNVDNHIAHFHGDKESLITQMEACLGELEWHYYANSVQLRKDMFNILKYGKVEDE